MLIILFSLAFFNFFFINELYFLIPPIVARSYNPTAELVIPPAISTKGAKSIVKKYTVTTETKITMQFKAVKAFSCFLLIN